MAFPFVSVTGDQDGKSDIKPDEQWCCMPFIPTLMCPPFTNSPLPHFMFTDFSFYTFFSPPRFETSLFLSTFGVGVTVLSAPPTPPATLLSLFSSAFRNSLSIALLTATHQPGCNLKSPSTAAIPQGWLSVQLPKPRQGLCFSKQLWTSGWFPQFQINWRWKTLFLKDWFSRRQGRLSWSFEATSLLPSWCSQHLACSVVVWRQIVWLYVGWWTWFNNTSMKQCVELYL